MTLCDNELQCKYSRKANSACIERPRGSDMKKIKNDK